MGRPTYCPFRTVPLRRFQRRARFKTPFAPSRSVGGVNPQRGYAVRTTMLLAALATVALLVVTGSASGSDEGVVASASGGWTMNGEAAGSTFEIQPFTFTVRIHADGSVAGRFNYTQVRDGGEPLVVKGSLDCATIVGNQAWVGGVIEESSRDSLVGLDMWFQVQDNGEPGSGGEPDMSSTIGAGGPGTGDAYCADAPVVRFPFFLDAGNVQVRPAA